MQVLYPVFAMFLLTTVVAFRLGGMRYAAVKKRTVDARYYRAYRDYEEPEHLRVLSRHLINLFEQPVLFYLGIVIAYMTGQTGVALVAVAWIFVLFRYLHSYIHLTSNVVIWRFRVFILSWLALVAFWALLFVNLVSK